MSRETAEALEPSKNNPSPVADTARQPKRNSAPQLDRDDFPDPPLPGGHGLRLTLENVEHLLCRSGIEVRFDVIKKRLVARKDEKPFSQTEIASVASRYGLNGGWLLAFIHEIGVRNPYNPVREWIESKPWDGVDRLADILATVHTVEDYPIKLKKALISRWLFSATAAAMIEGKRFAGRGVLTLQGTQGAGKTSWIASLLPAGTLRETLVKRDHHMDGGDKDSILSAIAHWITEIGELDSSFRKDVARLKGFLTNDCDKIRPPYGKHELEYDRRTVFAATVNDQAFLVDPTGNSRFWTVSVDKLDFNHEIDTQQLFAQLQGLVEAGAQWWLTADEEKMLAAYNLQHRAVSAIAERVKDYVDLDAVEQGKGSYMTAMQMLAEIGVSNPSNGQCKECGSVLRELFGQPKRVQGRDKWRVPKRPDHTWTKPVEEDESEVIY